MNIKQKLRWREAVCLMMILSDPFITPEAITHLGKQMALLFRQVNLSKSFAKSKMLFLG